MIHNYCYIDINEKVVNFLLSFIFCFTAFSQETDDDQSDFGVPNQKNQLSKEDSECALSEDSELIKLLNFKLKNLILLLKNLKAVRH